MSLQTNIVKLTSVRVVNDVVLLCVLHIAHIGIGTNHT